jgi:hypothetical protein
MLLGCFEVLKGYLEIIQGEISESDIGAAVNLQGCFLMNLLFFGRMLCISRTHYMQDRFLNWLEAWNVLEQGVHYNDLNCLIFSLDI